jgi:SNF2 family DNA or RNA helicase
MLRRKKEDVLKELPAKQRFSVPFELPNGIGILQDDLDGMPVIEQINLMKRMTAKAKLPQAIEWLEDMIESGNKIVAFAIHHEIIDSIMSKFPGAAVKLDGRDSQEQRNISVDRFQNDDSVRLFIGNIRAAGVGITLTKAAHAVFIELDWVPGSHIQAEDRIHRIGQTESVTCWYLLAADTIEEDIFDLLYRKKQVIDSVLDGKQSEDESIIGALAKKYCGGKK